MWDFVCVARDFNRRASAGDYAACICTHERWLTPCVGCICTHERRLAPFVGYSLTLHYPQGDPASLARQVYHYCAPYRALPSSPRRDLRHPTIHRKTVQLQICLWYNVARASVSLANRPVPRDMKQHRHNAMKTTQTAIYNVQQRNQATSRRSG